MLIEDGEGRVGAIMNHQRVCIKQPESPTNLIFLQIVHYSVHVCSFQPAMVTVRYVMLLREQQPAGHTDSCRSAWIQSHGIHYCSSVFGNNLRFRFPK